MEGLFFAIGFLLGSVAGVLIMCLLQINRIGKKEDADCRTGDQYRLPGEPG